MKSKLFNMSRAQRRFRNPDRNRTHDLPKHWVGALYTELRELMERKAISLICEPSTSSLCPTLVPCCSIHFSYFISKLKIRYLYSLIIPSFVTPVQSDYGQSKSRGNTSANKKKKLSIFLIISYF